MPNDILTRAIDELCEGSHLTADHTSAVLAEIMEGRGGEAQTAAFLIALRAKGETVPELVGLARTMRDLAAEVEVDPRGPGRHGRDRRRPDDVQRLDHRGADRRRARAAAVAKHGNRSATSRCGSADLLEALGVKIELTPEQVATCIEEIGFGFMFAPKHHAATKHVVPVRKELAVRTIFNFLGPLTNPAGARRQLLGVSDRTYQETIAEALIGLGLRAGAGGLGGRRHGRAQHQLAHAGDRGRRRQDRGVVRRGLRPRPDAGPDRGGRRRRTGGQREGGRVAARGGARAAA